MRAIDPTNTINCCVCCNEIPHDAAFTPERAEYVEHFCGLDCYASFQARANAVPESNTTSIAHGIFKETLPVGI